MSQELPVFPVSNSPQYAAFTLSPYPKFPGRAPVESASCLPTWLTRDPSPGAFRANPADVVPSDVASTDSFIALGLRWPKSSSARATSSAD
jgi:hypothetical protein